MDTIKKRIYTIASILLFSVHSSYGAGMFEQIACVRRFMPTFSPEWRSSQMFPALVTAVTGVGAYGSQVLLPMQFFALFSPHLPALLAITYIVCNHVSGYRQHCLLRNDINDLSKRTDKGFEDTRERQTEALRLATQNQQRTNKQFHEFGKRQEELEKQLGKHSAMTKEQLANLSQHVTTIGNNNNQQHKITQRELTHINAQQSQTTTTVAQVQTQLAETNKTVGSISAQQQTMSHTLNNLTTTTNEHFAQVHTQHKGLENKLTAVQATQKTQSEQIGVTVATVVHVQNVVNGLNTQVATVLKNQADAAENTKNIADTLLRIQDELKGALKATEFYTDEVLNLNSQDGQKAKRKAQKKNVEKTRYNNNGQTDTPRADY